MANRYKDPDELNKRYMPENNGRLDDDEGEEIPEEELTEEEKKWMNTIGSLTAKDWQMIIEAIMDEEDYTLSDEEYGAKTILAKLNSKKPTDKDNMDAVYKFKLSIAKLITPDEAILMVERLRKKPDEGANIPPDILDMIYAKAKEYKG